MFDYCIVGAGLAGCVLAERLASQAGRRVLVVERRDHIGGNCFDYYDEAGILVHKYGPHYFRTNRRHVFAYLSQFTDWHYVYYRIRVMVDGRLVPLPINLDTVNELYGSSWDSEACQAFFARTRATIPQPANSEEVILAKVGRDLYEKIYEAYTVKQWGLSPRELDPSVCARIPVRFNRDDRYFTDRYQAMPKDGYHRLFARLLAHPKIHLLLKTDWHEIRQAIPFGKLIYTGPIDAFFDHCYGRLPYRSLRFEHETLDQEVFQPVSQVNYPVDYDFTRIVEIKHVTGQRHPKTTIVREYPEADGEPYYPVPRPESQALLEQYLAAARPTGVHFIGRLAQYRYLNMDEVVDEALALFERLAAAEVE
ncbi:MAG: UDP-galactopyranose mutase [Thermodesulfobacteriota bacterium]